MNEQAMHREPERGFDAAKLVTGLLLVTFGLVFLLDRLYWLEAREMLRLWPLWLIAFGVIRVMFPSHHRGRLAGFWPILIGGIFLLDTLDVMALHDSWPLFIVGGGLIMVLRALRTGGGAK